jgi:imidazolonepropionase-like amidohydrolase
LATLGAARIMHHDAERGSITEGKQADVILVDGDPTTRISDIRKVELTVRGGVVYRRADLYRVLGITSGAE